MKSAVLTFLVISMCIMSATGAIIAILTNQQWNWNVVPSKSLRVPVRFTTKNQVINSTQFGGVLCRGGSGGTMWDSMSSRLEIMLKADPVTMQANCVGVINLETDKFDFVDTNKRVVFFMTFSPGSLNLFKYSLHHINKWYSVDNLFDQVDDTASDDSGYDGDSESGDELMATNSQDKANLMFNIDGQYYTFDASFTTGIQTIKTTTYQTYTFQINISEVGTIA